MTSSDRNHATQALRNGKFLGLLRKFCVSEFRQNQEFHVINVHNDGLFPLTTSLPIERDGMRAARGVNAVALYRES